MTYPAPACRESSLHPEAEPGLPCRAAVAAHGRCLAHLDEGELQAHIDALEPGSDIDARKVVFTRKLLTRLLEGLTPKGSAGALLGAADFRDATFTEKADFDHAVFSSTAGFSGAAFLDVPDFDKASFHGPANFEGASFRTLVVFRRVTFRDTADFTGVAFRGSGPVIVFDRATFLGRATFEEADFHRNASFTGAVFSEAAVFRGATFRAAAWFGRGLSKKASFKDRADFAGAGFSGLADFRGVEFAGDADFSGATFHQRAVFQDVSLLGSADFSGAESNRPEDFAGVASVGPVSDSSTALKPEPDPKPAPDPDQDSGPERNSSPSPAPVRLPAAASVVLGGVRVVRFAVRVLGLIAVIDLARAAVLLVAFGLARQFSEPEWLRIADQAKQFSIARWLHVDGPKEMIFRPPADWLFDAGQPQWVLLVNLVPGLVVLAVVWAVLRLLPGPPPVGPGTYVVVQFLQVALAVTVLLYCYTVRTHATWWAYLAGVESPDAVPSGDQAAPVVVAGAAVALIAGVGRFLAPPVPGWFRLGRKLLQLAIRSLWLVKVVLVVVVAKVSVDALIEGSLPTFLILVLGGILLVWWGVDAVSRGLRLAWLHVYGVAAEATVVGARQETRWRPFTTSSQYGTLTTWHPYDVAVVTLAAANPVSSEPVVLLYDCRPGREPSEGTVFRVRFDPRCPEFNSL